ncbi:hypothetical protein [Tepidanaerobacter syntrophicus]|uniref:hypothetical protein n=1 Tax=Tepidanaerobacter syntrophicus TaxID=224999 RepID=UPI001BD4DC52|nr:hypothetical protein [Tepidanaerobacter syntrophicus]
MTDISFEAQAKRLEDIKEQSLNLTSINSRVEPLADIAADTAQLSKLEDIKTLLTAQKPTMIASGSIDVPIGEQYPTSDEINEPPTIYRQFLLVFYNECDKALDSITTFNVNAYVDGSPMSILTIPAKTVTYGAASSAGALFFDGMTCPYLFTASSTIMLQFNLAAGVEVAGTIYWRLYGQ